eukprot:SAG22_NODE_10256_length_545_cov_0.697309_2_plen_121_part_01
MPFDAAYFTAFFVVRPNRRLLPLPPGLEWERVKNGVNVDDLKIIGPDDFETLQDIPTFGQARIRQRIAEIGENSGSFTVDGKYEVVYAKVGTNKDFVTCAVTRQVEILQSIADQTDAIDSS